MKRFAWLFLCLALGTFAYTGCGGGSDTSAPDVNVEEEPEMGAPAESGTEKKGTEEKGGGEKAAEETPQG